MATVRFKASTCAPCRLRKLRCDGESPCGTCSRARTLVVCTYIPRTVRHPGLVLPRGGACLSCRRRKRRCDGNFPCQSCTDTSRLDECQYGDNALSRKDESAAQPREPDGASTNSSRSTNRYSSSYGSAHSVPLELSDVADLYIPRPESDAGFASDRVPYADSIARSACPSMLGLSEYSLNSRSTASDVNALPSFPELVDPIRNYISRPPFPRDPAEDRTAELFAVRNLFLDHSWNYLLDISVEMREALSRGDTSGLIVHPILVNVCQLLGYHIVKHLPDRTWLYLQDPTEGEVAQASLISDVLQKGPNILDPVTTMQVYSLFALYYAMEADVATFAQLFDQLGDIFLRNLLDLGFDDALPLSHTHQLDASSSGPWSSAREARSAFSGMIWLELGRIFVLKLPPLLHPSIWTKFRQLATTQHNGTEINLMRAKSTLFLFDTQQLVSDWTRWDFGDPASAADFTRYWQLIEDIYAHLRVINTPLLEVSFIHEAQVITLKSAVIVAQAALAQLYALSAPFQPESRRKHSEVVEDIAAITSMFSMQDFRYLDATLGVSWLSALRPIYGHSPGYERPQPALDIIREAHQRLSEATPYVPDL
ncbi:hypothetical protein DFH09DRAFT_1148898 [Mycena vulgaris]|nr:hypothetical protein DFH09DRAFT_1148898 [Mycena vulgaris]